MARGNGIAIVVILIIVIIILLVWVFRGIYERSTADFGTWNEFQTTLCLNEGQDCTVEGTSQRFRTCNPNPRTGYGCIDTNGVHTYKPETIDVSCNTLCFTSVFEVTVADPCSVYLDEAGTTLATNQTCRNNNPNHSHKMEQQNVEQQNIDVMGSLHRLEGQIFTVSGYFRNSDTQTAGVDEAIIDMEKMADKIRSMNFVGRYDLMISKKEDLLISATELRKIYDASQTQKVVAIPVIPVSDFESHDTNEVTPAREIYFSSDDDGDDDDFHNDFGDYHGETGHGESLTSLLETIVDSNGDNNYEEHASLESTSVQRDVAELHQLFGSVAEAVHNQGEQIEFLQGSVENTFHGNEIVQTQVKQSNSWADMLRRNKLVVGVISVASTLLVVVPTTVAVLVKRGQKPTESIEDP